MKPFLTLMKTELKLSLRGMDMLIFALCLPLAALILLGVIYAGQPAYPGAPYTFLDQSFGALTTISICAGGVMGLPLVVSDYRSKRILRRFQVTPVSPALLLAVQLAIYALYALASLLLLYFIATLFFGCHLTGGLLPFLLSYLLVLFSLFSLGLMVGGLARDAKIAGAIASALYFPMLIFSGATLPYEVMPAFLQHVADVMPLTQGIKLLKAASLGLAPDLTAILILLLVGVVSSAIAVRYFKWT